MGVAAVENKLEGTVENITFQAPDGSFTVFRLKPGNEVGSVAVTGNFPPPLVGEQVSLTGDWVEHARYGRQFKAASCRRIAPTSEKGIERFLASGAIKGIGPAMAARLVNHFGARTLEVIELFPHRLAEVEGIGSKKAEQIRQSFAEQAELKEVMLYLEMRGVTGAYAARIFACYGSDSIAVLEAEPYRLAEEVKGIGFRIADQIAMAIGFDKRQPARLAAGVQFALLMTGQAGHCCVPAETLTAETAKLLTIDAAEIAGVVSEQIRLGKLYTEDFHGMTLVYPRYLFRAEKQVAERLLTLKDKAKPISGVDSETLVNDWEALTGVPLAAAQREALAAALNHGVLVLTGGPGTGKTTTVKGILALLEQHGFKIVLGAPTGRAAKRLAETTGREASTIHRLLEAGGGVEEEPMFARDELNPLDADVVIVDETSMMDMLLMSCFLQAVPDGCRVVLVGDVDQLPAVGPGSVLKDIIRSGVIPVVRLTEVFRQTGESMIVLNAHRINHGRLPEYGTRDFQFREIEGSEAAAQAIVELCQHELAQEGFDIWRDVQVLSPMHRQPCGVENLNRLLQAALNPPVDGKDYLQSVNQVLREGDKVMQIRNNYIKRVFNGDIGYILAIADGKVMVRYPEDDVVYEKGEYDELTLAYAMSVHKSQGSEYPVVVMPLTPGHHIMLQRNLLYTAVTRAKERVILLGTRAALNTAVLSDRTRRRYSLLAERLRGESLW
ncbi:SF1B family DNA helicase RecD2 [Sporomusa acidovorans]|uniref:ATP-dependent RecD2 DNA helicase n=1 Tax=Sporomusa acidovorans (strain ATCC 49682 / DSM 3132 / Mol) TaxID=1123286 RepID=A0ABZ3J7J8_SPOA4|nr:ATP-dependent RecD-like DNA helicase [Sporomusa acidovorans]OZC19404.1 ATP-dependent RecD-like DNA helicase [Sporomusa acidovorans DSM 3132]SDD77689.1 exodeoxyribonuclease V alpha subunit [Sporomusa acidovorans]